MHANTRQIGRKLFTAAVLLAAGLLPICMWRAPATSAPPDLDPLPIQRILVPPEKLADEMERAGQPTLVPMPRKEFEGLVSRAAEKVSAWRAPHLIEARYHAAWTDAGIQGTADWTIDHLGPGTGRFSLQMHQFAIRSARWKNGEDAVIGFLDDQPNAPLELLVAHRGQQKLQLEWSVRTVAEPGGARIELQFPACPISTLELELPSYLIPQSNRESFLLTDPRPAAKTGWKTWRFSFGGRASSGQAMPVMIVLRNAQNSARMDPLLHPLYETRQRLVPGQVECEFTIDLRVHRGEVKQLLFDADPTLRIMDISLPNIERWETKSDSKTAQVVVQLSEPFGGGRFVIKALAPLPDAATVWVSPHLRIAGATSRGEMVHISVHPSMAVHHFNGGSYRLIENRVRPDRFQEVSLLEVQSENPQRPSANILFLSPAFDLKQDMDWRIEPGEMTLTVQLQLKLRQGMLTQLPISLPPNWALESANATPADPGLRVRPEIASVVIEPGKAVLPNDPNRNWTLRFRAPLRLEAAGATLPLPDLTPTGDCTREGTLFVRAGPTLSVTSPTTPSTGRGEAAFPIKTGALNGVVQVTPRTGRIRAQANGEAILSGDRLRTKYELLITPIAGTVSDLVLLSNLPLELWSIRTRRGNSEIARVEPWLPAELPLQATCIGAQTPWKAIYQVLQAQALHGRWQRVIFDRSISGPVTLELISEIAVKVEQFPVPSIAVVGADRFEGRVGFFSKNGDSYRPQPPNGRESRPTTHRGDRLEFAFTSTPSDIVLDRASTLSSNRGFVVADLALQVFENGIGGTFRFALQDWRDDHLEVHLPEGAKLISTHIDGKSARVSSGPDERRAMVHWPAGAGIHFAEVAYFQPMRAQPWPTRLTAPNPQLPTPTIVRRIWRLPEQLMPLQSEAWRRRSPAATATMPTLWNNDQQPDLVRWKNKLQEAAKSIPSGTSFREALFSIASAFAAQGERLVFDSRALIAAESKFDDEVSETGSLDWLERSGLDIAACPSAAVLTSKPRAHRWSPRPPPEICRAVEDAVYHGRDATGDFRLIPDWSSADRPSQSEIADDDIADWQEWEAATGNLSDSIIVVPMRFTRSLGLIIAALVGLFVWQSVARKWRVRWAMVLLLGGLSGLAWLWLPESLQELGVWPFAAVAAGVSIALLYSGVAHQPLKRPEKSRPAIVAAGIIALAFALHAIAAEPAPARVYIVSTEPERVLVPPTLLDQLRSLVRRGAPTASAVLVGANYEGRIVDETAEFDAQFVLQSFGEKPASFVLPLSGIQLREALLNGKPAYPKAAGERYIFEVSGAGRHTLSIRFIVPTSGVVEREVRFAIPELAFGTLAFETPVGSSDLQALTARGMQRVEPRPNGLRLHADLGRTASVLLRWRHAGTVDAPVRPRVQELCLWDIQEGSAKLTAVFRYNFANSVVRDLEIKVPKDLQVANVEVRGTDDRSAFVGLPGIRDWQMIEQNDTQRLRLFLTHPFHGVLQFVLELLPRTALGSQLVLSVPTASEASDRESFIAARLQGWQGTIAEARGLVRTSEELFFRDQWQPLRLDAGTSAPQFAFHCVRPDSNLRLALQSPPPKTTAAQTIHWTVAAGRADFRAEAHWIDPAVPGFVEWDIPAAVSIDEVRGDDLRYWSRNGNRLQLWFDRSSDESARPVSVRVSGWLPRPSSIADQEKMPFRTPGLSLPNAAVQTTTIHVRPGPELRLRLKDAGPFRTLPDSDLPGYGWSGHSQTAGAATLDVLVASGGIAEATVLAQAELAGRALAFTNYVMLEPIPDLPQDRPNTVWIDVYRSDATRLTLDLPSGARLRETRTGPGLTSWAIDLAAVKTALTVSSRRTLTSSQEFVAPLVSVRGAAKQTRQLVLHSTDLLPLDSNALQRTAATGSAASTWRIAPELTRLQLRYAPGRGASTTGAKVIATTAAAAVAPTGDWMVRAVFHIVAFSETETSIAWPAGAEILAVEINGNVISPAARHGPLPFAPGVHDLRLLWRTSDAIHAGQNQFKMPLLSGLDRSSVQWQIVPAPGYRVAAVAPKSMSATGQELQIAADWDRALRTHSDKLPADLLRVLSSRRDAALRLADTWHRVSPASPGESGSDGVDWNDWLREARNRRIPEEVLPPIRPHLPFEELFERRPAWRGKSDSGDLTLEMESEPVGSPPQMALTVALGIMLAIGIVCLPRFGKIEKK